MTNNIDQILDNTQGIIEGYASFFNVIDADRDQVARGAFQRSLRAWRVLRKNPKMLWQHDSKKPIGIWTDLFEDDKGLYVKGKLALGVSQANEAYYLLKTGVLEGLSIGFRTIKAVRERHTKSRVLLDLDLIEISLVTFGANPKATIHLCKSL